MPKSNQDRQDTYQDKIRRGELVRFQFSLPIDGSGRLVKYLCNHLDCTRTELFDRLLKEEWHRQGEPLTITKP